MTILTDTKPAQVLSIEEVGDAFAKALTEKFEGKHICYIEKGRRFDKIVTEIIRGNGRSVHAFVEKSTGALIKAATWKAPQKNADGTLAVRYLLDTEENFAIALEAADWAGSYLYKR